MITQLQILQTTSILPALVMNSHSKTNHCLVPPLAHKHNTTFTSTTGIYIQSLPTIPFYSYPTSSLLFKFVYQDNWIQPSFIQNFWNFHFVTLITYTPHVPFPSSRDTQCMHKLAVLGKWLLNPAACEACLMMCSKGRISEVGFHRAFTIISIIILI